MSANVICFDLEGPLSPQDNAYEVMGLIENGHKIFEVLSRYDDILTLEGREDYEPGDTLSLIIPFLLYHGISESDIENVSDRARIVDGVDYTISRLKALGWEIFVISTSYQQHAFNIGRKIGISEDRIYCTKFSLDRYRKEAKNINFSVVKDVEKEILKELYPNLENFDKIKKRLDKFFYNDILKTRIGKFMKKVRVVGGQRKVDAIYKISERSRTPIGKIVVVGDSITDYKMLNEVKSKGGLSIVFNGNEYAIHYANVGIASADMRFILILLNAYMQGGKKKVMETVNFLEKEGKNFLENTNRTRKILPKAKFLCPIRKYNFLIRVKKEIIPADIIDFLIKKSLDKNFTLPYFHYIENLSKEKQRKIMEIHKKFRALVRGDAAKLG